MLIFVKTPIRQTMPLHVEASDTVANVKGKISENEGISFTQLRLKFEGKELKDGSTLIDYNIQEKYTLDLDREVIVDLDRTHNTLRLGLSIERRTSGTILGRSQVFVAKIHELSLFDLWNGDHPSDAVCIGDEIVGVNDADNITEELLNSDGKRLQICIRKTMELKGHYLQP